MSRKLGAELERGDALEFLGEFHVLADVEQAAAATRRIVPGALRAVAPDGWSMTIDPTELYEVGL